MSIDKKRIPWNKNKKGLQKWSLETREKMKNRVPWNKGTIGLRKCSIVTKEKMSAKKKGKKNPFYGKTHTKEVKKKLKKAHIGKKLSILMKKKISESLLGNTRSLGFKHTKETRQKMKNSRFGRIFTQETRIKMGKKRKGKNHWNWQGGKTSINMKIRNSIEIKLWKEAVFKRDNYTCQKCKKRGGKLTAHHIINFSKSKELRTSITNGITLCWNCHSKFHKKYGKKDNTKRQINNFLLKNQTSKIT